MQALFRGAPQTLEQVFEAAERGETNSFDLAWRASMRSQSEHSNVRSENVVAVLAGSDPQLRSEYVIYTGHLDHLGVGEPQDGDRIYNGAFDNASGIAVMIEVARAFRSLPKAPKRSLVFLAVTAEEKGLLGSKYFAEFPTVPATDIVANINLDMFLMLHPLKDIVAFGAEHSSLEKNVLHATKRLGVELTPDPMPEEVIFVRSDQYSFVRKGVPAVFLTAGFKGATPDGPTGPEWIRDRYHSQRDDMDQPMDLQSGVDFTRLNILIGYEVANDKARPRWNEGDFFGELFGSQRNW
jgi:Zn-dependent M28 family amino/carboxypeptidase